MPTSQHASEAGTASSDAAIDGGSDAAFDATLTAWRACGAHTFDPVRFRHIEALARRASAHGGAIRLDLERRLNIAIEAYAERRRQALAEMARTGASLRQLHPAAGADVERLLGDADIAGLRRLAARLDMRGDHAALADLALRINRRGAAAAPGDSTNAAPDELKSLRDGRPTWTRISIDRQLSRSVAKAPDHAGPLNSHHLMLRALQTMQNISPTYLERFVCYAEALSWLDQASCGVAMENARPARRDGERKRPRKRGR